MASQAKPKEYTTNCARCKRVFTYQMTYKGGNHRKYCGTCRPIALRALKSASLTRGLGGYAGVRLRDPDLVKICGQLAKKNKISRYKMVERIVRQWHDYKHVGATLSDPELLKRIRTMTAPGTTKEDVLEYIVRRYFHQQDQKDDQAGS